MFTLVLPNEKISPAVARAYVMEAIFSENILQAAHYLPFLGTEINARDADGNTLLNQALYTEQNIISHLLLDAGADPNLLDSSEASPLLIATARGVYSIFRRLLPAAKINFVNNRGWCLLGTALYNDRETYVYELLEHGAHWNASNAQGLTVLMCMAKMGKEKAIRDILDNMPANADWLIHKDTDHYTALMHSINTRTFNKECVTLLLTETMLYYMSQGIPEMMGEAIASSFHAAHQHSKERIIEIFSIYMNNADLTHMLHTHSHPYILHQAADSGCLQLYQEMEKNVPAEAYHTSFNGLSILTSAMRSKYFDPTLIQHIIKTIPRTLVHPNKWTILHEIICNTFFTPESLQRTYMLCTEDPEIAKILREIPRTRDASGLFPENYIRQYFMQNAHTAGNPLNHTLLQIFGEEDICPVDMLETAFLALLEIKKKHLAHHVFDPAQDYLYDANWINNSYFRIIQPLIKQAIEASKETPNAPPSLVHINKLIAILNEPLISMEQAEISPINAIFSQHSDIILFQEIPAQLYGIQIPAIKDATYTYWALLTAYVLEIQREINAYDTFLVNLEDIPQSQIQAEKRILQYYYSCLDEKLTTILIYLQDEDAFGIPIDLQDPVIPTSEASAGPTIENPLPAFLPKAKLRELLLALAEITVVPEGHCRLSTFAQELEHDVSTPFFLNCFPTTRKTLSQHFVAPPVKGAHKSSMDN